MSKYLIIAGLARRVNIDGTLLVLPRRARHRADAARAFAHRGAAGRDSLQLDLRAAGRDRRLGRWRGADPRGRSPQGPWLAEPVDARIGAGDRRGMFDPADLARAFGDQAQGR